MLMIDPHTRARLFGRQSAYLLLRPSPVTLAGPTPGIQRKDQKLPKARVEALVVRALKILSEFVYSPFQYEGACRAGIRAELCLDRWSWSQADKLAADVVAQALQKMGAVRPSWQEGQPDFATRTPVDFHWCQHCARQIPGERHTHARIWGLSVRYCSDECSQSAADRRNRTFVDHVDRATYLATLAAQKASRRLELERACKSCGTKFTPPPNAYVGEFCSIGCFHAERAKTAKRQWRDCSSCGKTFLSRNATCSAECRLAMQTQHPVRPCEICGTDFKPKTANKAVTRTCSRACGFELQRRNRLGLAGSATRFACEAL